MTKDQIRAAIRKAGCITWWPGGASHDAICEMQKSGEVVLEDVSGSQETKFEIRFSNAREGRKDTTP